MIFVTAGNEKSDLESDRAADLAYVGPGSELNDSFIRDLPWRSTRGFDLEDFAA